MTRLSHHFCCQRAFWSWIYSSFSCLFGVAVLILFHWSFAGIARNNHWHESWQAVIPYSVWVVFPSLERHSVECADASTSRRDWELWILKSTFVAIHLETDVSMLFLRISLCVKFCWKWSRYAHCAKNESRMCENKFESFHILFWWGPAVGLVMSRTMLQFCSWSLLFSGLKMCCLKLFWKLGCRCACAVCWNNSTTNRYQTEHT